MAYPVHVVLHGILGGGKLVLRDDVVLVVLEVALTVWLAQARQSVVLVAFVLSLVDHLLIRQIFGVGD